MFRPLRSRKPFPAVPGDLSTALAMLVAALLAGPTAAEEIDFDEDETLVVNENCCYLTDEYSHLGVRFETVDDGSIWGGRSDGNPGRWDLEGTRGSAFLGFNGASYGLTVHFDEPVVGFTLDAARALGSSGFAELRLWGMVGDEIVERVVVPLGPIDRWVTATVTSEVDAVRWKVRGDSNFRPYGVDHLRWEPATPPEPDPLELEIDLVAHGESHRVPLRRRGMLPVVVYGNEQVSVEDLDLASLVLGDDAMPRRRRRGLQRMDADGDGHSDVLLFFSTRASGLEVGDEWVCLEGQTRDGAPVTGCMAVEVSESRGRHLDRGQPRPERKQKRNR